MEKTSNRPTGAILLSYAGGLLVLVSGLSILLIGSFMSSISLIPGFSIGIIIVAAGAWGIISGLVMITGSYLIQTRPRASHTLWGILVFVFALTSTSVAEVSSSVAYSALPEVSWQDAGTRMRFRPNPRIRRKPESGPRRLKDTGSGSLPILILPIVRGSPAWKGFFHKYSTGYIRFWISKKYNVHECQ